MRRDVATRNLIKQLRVSGVPAASIQTTEDVAPAPGKWDSDLQEDGTVQGRGETPGEEQGPEPEPEEPSGDEPNLGRSRRQLVARLRKSRYQPSRAT